MTEFTAEDLAALAAAVYGEARGESRKGQDAVAHSAITRSKIADVSVADAVYGSVSALYGQYSFANPNRDGSESGHAKTITRAPKTDPDGWARAARVALDALTGRSKDPTDGATHYFNPAVAAPAWRNDIPFSTTIGKHQFHTDTRAGTRAIVRAAARSSHRRKALVGSNQVVFALGVPVPLGKGVIPRDVINKIATDYGPLSGDMTTLQEAPAPDRRMGERSERGEADKKTRDPRDNGERGTPDARQRDPISNIIMRSEDEPAKSKPRLGLDPTVHRLLSGDLSALDPENGPF